MIRLNWQRRLKMLFWQKFRVVTIGFAVILASLAYIGFFALPKGEPVELTMALFLPVTLFAVATGLLLTVLAVLLDN